jgi:hypothetical protein
LPKASRERKRSSRDPRNASDLLSNAKLQPPPSTSRPAAAQGLYDETKAAIDANWKRGEEIEDEYTRNAEEKFEHQIPRALATADRILAARLARVKPTEMSGGPASRPS